MASIPTKIPVPSESPRDLKFNAGKIDHFVTSVDEIWYTDRFGRKHKTLHGIQLDATERFNSQISEQSAAFIESLDNQSSQFQHLLLNSGYQFLGDYQDGPFQFSGRNQYIRWNNQYYRLNATTSVGFITTGTSAASFQNDLVHFVLIDGDTLRQNLASGEAAEGDALVAVKQPLAGAIERTQHDKNNETVSLWDFHYPGEGDDYAPALRRALATGVPIFLPPVNHTLRSTVSITSNTEIYGIPGKSKLSSPEAESSDGAEIIIVLISDGADNIYLHDFCIDGGCNELVTEKRNRRGIRLRDCTNIRYDNMEVSRTADWATSFERCKGVRAKNYTHVKATGALPGGRDGFHCLDCEDVVLDGADIDSGDDCVAATSETVGSHNITFKNIRGSSAIGSIAIYNEEHDASQPGGYAKMNASEIHFEDVRVKKGGTARNVVRIAKYNSLSSIKDCSVRSVSGEGYNHGAHLSGIDGLYTSGIDVSSTGQHGVYIAACNSVNGNVKGKTGASGFDGVNIFNGESHNLDAESNGSASYGIHLVGLKYSVVRPKAINCGVVDFSAGRGGGARVVNTVGVELPTGLLTGENTSSYYGLNAVPGSNTDLIVGDGVKRSGLIPSTPLSKINYLRQPAVSLKFKENNSQTITIFSSVGCTLTRNAVGNYTVNFTKAMDSTGFQFHVGAWHVGAERKVILSSATTENSLSFTVKDTSGVNTYADHISLIAYNT